MKEFFHGWRRKAGVVSLVLACALMGMWLRSHFYRDNIVSGLAGLTSSDGLLEFFIVEPRSVWIKPESLRWVSSARPIFETRGDVRVEIWGKEFVVLRMSEDYGGGGSANDNLMRVRRVTTPHCALILPLTLLSANLILCKPRKRQPTTSEPHA